MVKNIFKTFFIISTLSIVSCSEYLDLEPLSEETTASAYDRLSQVEAALTGTYESFQSDAYIWNNILFGDVRSDNYYAGGDNADIYQMDYLTISATNDKVEQSWSNIYNAILKANLVIDKAKTLNDPDLTEERRQQIIGEATFLRAFHYFSLVKLYGGVPLVLEPSISADPDIVRVSRSTTEEVYTQILLDLDTAAELLPDTYNDKADVNKARATAGAANALAAKASAQTKDYPKALQYIAKVEQSEANYTLLGNFAHLFDGNHRNNAESILEVQFLGGDEGNWGPQLLLPPSITVHDWRKFVTPSKNLLDAFDAQGDNVRKNASIIMEEVNWVDEYWGNTSGSSIPFAFKWKNADGGSSADRQYMLRYADIVLLKAEALNETDEQAKALKELNKIRARVGLSALTITDKVALRKAILDERRLELTQEAQRWDDLARHGLLLEVMNNLVEIDLRTNTPTNYEMTESKILLPIPQNELDRNPKLDPNP